jgi:predicted nucleic acid-binding protein
VNSSLLVVDASVALKWSRPEPSSVEARELLKDWRGRRVELLAPVLFIYEIASALAKRIRFGELTLEQATKRFQFFLASDVRLSRVEAHHLRALEIAARFHLSSAYDAH